MRQTANSHERPFTDIAGNPWRRTILLSLGAYLQMLVHRMRVIESNVARATDEDIVSHAILWWLRSWNVKHSLRLHRQIFPWWHRSYLQYHSRFTKDVLLAARDSSETRRLFCYSTAIVSAFASSPLSCCCHGSYITRHRPSTY